MTEQLRKRSTSPIINLNFNFRCDLDCKKDYLHRSRSSNDINTIKTPSSVSVAVPNNSPKKFNDKNFVVFDNISDMKTPRFYRKTGYLSAPIPKIYQTYSENSIPKNQTFNFSRKRTYEILDPEKNSEIPLYQPEPKKSQDMNEFKFNAGFHYSKDKSIPEHTYLVGGKIRGEVEFSKRKINLYKSLSGNTFEEESSSPRTLYFLSSNYDVYSKSPPASLRLSKRSCNLQGIPIIPEIPMEPDDIEDIPLPPPKKKDPKCKLPPGYKLESDLLECLNVKPVQFYRHDLSGSRSPQVRIISGTFFSPRKLNLSDDSSSPDNTFKEAVGSPIYVDNYDYSTPQLQNQNFNVNKRTLDLRAMPDDENRKNMTLKEIQRGLYELRCFEQNVKPSETTVCFPKRRHPFVIDIFSNSNITKPVIPKIPIPVISQIPVPVIPKIPDISKIQPEAVICQPAVRPVSPPPIRRPVCPLSSKDSQIEILDSAALQCFSPRKVNLSESSPSANFMLNSESPSSYLNDLANYNSSSGPKDWEMAKKEYIDYLHGPQASPRSVALEQQNQQIHTSSGRNTDRKIKEIKEHLEEIEEEEKSGFTQSVKNYQAKRREELSKFVKI